MSCCNTCCFEDWICQCVPYGNIIIINSDDLTSSNYFVITDKFGNKYKGKLEQEYAGVVGINTNLLPDGLLTQYSGDFRVQFFADAISEKPLDIRLTRSYDCLELSVKGGTIQKDEIGER